MSKSITSGARVGLALVVLAGAAGTTGGAAAAGAWPTGVTPVESKDGQVVTVKGDLAAGKAIPLTFAAKSSVACFPATEFDNFRGNHVFYGTTLPKDSVMTITAIPDDPKTDVNLYAVQVGSTDFKRIPPNVPTAVACEASYDQKTDSNPGVTEKVVLNATTNPYNVVIGVAGPKGVTSGGYTLKVELKTKAAAPTAVLVPIALESKADGVVTAKGKLDGGAKVDLKFASNSSVACFPATENLNFDGNHVLYRTTIPPYSDMTITATPSDPKLDVSLYAYMVSATDTKTIVPNVPSAVTCEAGYDAKTDANPGKPETVKLNALKNPYAVYIGVAGAKGTTSGAFDLKVEIKPKK